MKGARGNPVDSAVQALIIERTLPLNESKMQHQFDHRLATYDGVVDAKGVPTARNVTTEEKERAGFCVTPRYSVAQSEVEGALSRPSPPASRGGWRKIARSTDERTMIAMHFPLGGLGDSGNLVLGGSDTWALLGFLESFALDFVARQKLGGTNFNFFQFQEIPAIAHRTLEDATAWGSTESVRDWLRSRVLELTYTAWDRASFAEGQGDTDPEGQVIPPFIWDDERRPWIRAEWDAAFFHLYGMEASDVGYIMDKFLIVRRKDEVTYSEYRTRNRILAVYDALQSAAAVGEPNPSFLDPAPGHGLRHESRKDCA